MKSTIYFSLLFAEAGEMWAFMAETVGTYRSNLLPLSFVALLGPALASLLFSLAFLPPFFVQA